MRLHKAINHETGRSVASVIESEGGVITHCEIGGKHAFIHFMLDGTPRRVTVPITPSDYRSSRNCATEARRNIRWWRDPASVPCNLTHRNNFVSVAPPYRGPRK